jgi:hypothetical protein
LIGPQELSAGEVTIRDLRSADFEQHQSRVPDQDVVSTILRLLQAK